jgi:NADH-quinone oxidoreductase subunit F
MQNWREYKKVLLPDIPNYNEIDVYTQHGGYEMLRQVMTSSDWNRKKVIDEVKAANIRGRGGAGFNAGLKWSFMPPKKPGVPRYLACNGDESEPGTFKDRRLYEFNPHQFIEGAIIACFAMEMDAAYVYIRGEYMDYIDIMQKAVDQAYAKGFAGKNLFGTGITIDVYVHTGAGAYICGEETSLMESLEGNRPYPRSKPPFPAQYGLWGKPTTINNIETLANVPLVIRHGAAWWSSQGAPTHPGPLLYGVSGHVNRPGVYEYPTGMKITDMIFEVAGGMRNNKEIKLVVPGGSSCPFLTRDEVMSGLTMDSDSLRSVGSVLGTAGMCVLNEDTDIVKFTYRVAKFYDHESCGQCTPCREGTGWFVRVLRKFVDGTATMRDMDTLLNLCDTLEGRTVCALADATAWPVRSALKKFRPDFEKRVSVKVAHPVS